MANLSIIKMSHYVTEVSESILWSSIKISDKVKKRKKTSCREMVEEFKIVKMQARSNVEVKKARLSVEYETFQGKGFKHIQ